MNDDLAEFLGGLEPLVQEMAVWGNGRLPLEVTYYLTTELPPLAYVSSVRAVVFRDGAVLVVRDPKGGYHIVPGGRGEKGETAVETLRREMLEETGWVLRDTTLLGVIHYHHLAPKPADYAYPHPDFLQLVYVAEAERFVPEAMVFDEYVVESHFWQVGEIRPLLRSPGQVSLLDAAIRHNDKLL